MPSPPISRPASSRPELIRHLGEYLDRAYYPRFGLLLIVSTAGLAGFLTSAALLDAGWSGMAGRYALASLVAYLVFLGLVRLWARYYRHLHPDLPADALNMAGDLVQAVPESGFSFGGGGGFSGGGAGRSLAEATTAHIPEPAITPSLVEGAAGASKAAESSGSALKSLGAVADLDEGAVWLAPLILAGALVVGLISALLVIFGAPTLLGEVLLDAGLAGLIYRRLHQYPTQHWLSGVLRRTWKPMLAIVVVLVAAAATAQHLRPTADSIGDFFR